MKWLVAAFLVCLVRHGSGGAIKCLPSSTDPECAVEVKGLSIPQENTPPEQKQEQVTIPETVKKPEALTVPEVSVQEAECLAGSEWNSHCYSCRCSGLGIANCTRIEECKELKEAKPILCKPTTTFQRGCNTCTCLENGLGLCTLQSCNTVSPVPPGLPADSTCTPGTSWKITCNTCTCNDNGQLQCTEKACLDEEAAADSPNQSADQTCTPGTAWKIDCNTCTCVHTGQLLCTQTECQDEQGEPIKTKPLEGHDCAPGTSWRAKCNTCICTHDGWPSCTDVGCLVAESEPPMKCAPKSAWKEGCNDCWCTDSGEPLCTRLACFNNIKADNLFFDSKAQEKDEAQMEKESQEKSAVKNNLNEAEWDELHNMVKRSQVCKPNEDFQSDCNTCKCAGDGLSYRCTQNECMDKEEGVDKEVEVFMENEGVDHIERHSVCRAQGVFYIGCNTCHCNYDGTDYTCTNKPCPLPDDVELFHELRATKLAQNKTVVCVANRMFIKDCNTCWCNEDGTGFFCTRKVCVSELPDEGFDFDKPEELRKIQRTCRPDEVFEIDCNMCRCNPDGQSFSCTRRACLSEEAMTIEGVQYAKTESSRKIRAVSQEPPRKACQPGQEFRMDCNKCLCDFQGQDFSCTRMNCREVNVPGVRRKRDVTQQQNASCVPGSVFEQGCNVCRCNDDGIHATCTIKSCLKPGEEDENQLPEADPNFRCYPGEQFKRSCNDCTCSADGRSVFCTLHVCEKDLSPKF